MRKHKIINGDETVVENALNAAVADGWTLQRFGSTSCITTDDDCGGPYSVPPDFWALLAKDEL